MIPLTELFTEARSDGLQSLLPGLIGGMKEEVREFECRPPEILEMFLLT